MWTWMEESLRNRTGKRSFQKEGGSWTVSQKQEQVGRTEQGAGPEEVLPKLNIEDAKRAK